MALNRQKLANNLKAGSSFMNITSKYRSLSIQARAALWFTICSFLQKGISFITVPIFTRLMSTEEYGTYTVYLSWLQILTILTSLYLFNGVYDNAMAKYEKQRDANVVLNFIFIRIFGYVAAGYTTLACYILYSVGHYVVSKRILVAEGIEENLMDAGFLLACSAFLIGLSVICNLLFPYRILRYAILFASAGLVFWKRELLLNTMADIRKK